MIYIYVYIYTYVYQYQYVYTSPVHSVSHYQRATVVVICRFSGYVNLKKGIKEQSDMHTYQTTMLETFLFAAAGAVSAGIVAAVHKHALNCTRELLGLKKASNTITGGVRPKSQRSKKPVLHKTIAKKPSADQAAPSRDAASKAKGKKPASPKKASNRTAKVAKGLVSSHQKLIEERKLNEEHSEGPGSKQLIHYQIITYVTPLKDGEPGRPMFVLKQKGREISLMGLNEGPVCKRIVLSTHVMKEESKNFIIQMDEASVSEKQGQELIYMDVDSLMASADNKTSHGFVVQGEMVDIVKKCVEKVLQMHEDNRK